MPAISKAQFRFMKLLEHSPQSGSIKPKGFSSAEAKEYTKENIGKKSYKNLPEKAPKFKKLKKMLSRGE